MARIEADVDRQDLLDAIAAALIHYESPPYGDLTANRWTVAAVATEAVMRVLDPPFTPAEHAEMEADFAAEDARLGRS